MSKYKQKTIFLVFAILLLAGVFIAQTIFGLFLFRPKGTLASPDTKNWDFSVDTDYTFDSAKIEVDAGNNDKAQLKGTSTDTDYTTSNDKIQNNNVNDVYVYDASTETIKDPSDDFYGASIDTNRWTEYSSGSGTQAIESNYLKMTAGGTVGTGGVKSTWELTGDFDVSIDYDLTTFPATDYGYFFFQIRDDANDNIIHLRRTRGSALNRHCHRLRKDGVWRAETIVNTSDTSGKYRIVRSGTTITTYYHNGTNWVQHSQETDTFAIPLKVYIYAYSGTGFPTIEIHADNFNVISGPTNFSQSELWRTHPKMRIGGSWYNEPKPPKYYVNARDFEDLGGNFITDWAIYPTPYESATFIRTAAQGARATVPLYNLISGTYKIWLLVWFDSGDASADEISMELNTTEIASHTKSEGADSYIWHDYSTQTLSPSSNLEVVMKVLPEQQYIPTVRAVYITDNLTEDPNDYSVVDGQTIPTWITKLGAFPEKAYLIATDGGLDIIDASDDSLWMRFDGGSLYNMVRGQATTVFGLNGKVYHDAPHSSGYGSYIIDLLRDRSLMYYTDVSQGNGFEDKGLDAYHDGGDWGTVIERNIPYGWDKDLITLPNLINATVNDIHAKVISDKTYVAVATDGGVSVINETDNSGANSSETTAMTAVHFDASNDLYYSSGTTLYKEATYTSNFTADSTVTGLAGDIREISSDDTNLYVATADNVTKIPKADIAAGSQTIGSITNAKTYTESGGGGDYAVLAGSAGDCKSVAVSGDYMYVGTDGAGADDGAVSIVDLTSNTLLTSYTTATSPSLLDNDVSSVDIISLAIALAGTDASGANKIGVTYNTSEPTVVNNTGQVYTTLSSFTETLGSGSHGSIKYQISNNGSNWYYWNSSNWVSATEASHYNDVSTVNANISQFVADVGTGTFYFKAFLISDGAEKPILDNIASGYISQAPTAPTDLLCEGETNPTEVVDTKPEFSSIFDDPQGEGEYAQYYQIQVIADGGSFDTPLWDSTKTQLSEYPPGVAENARCADIEYGGDPLSIDGTKYYWRMKYWDDEDNEGAFSDGTANFTMAASSPGTFTIKKADGCDCTCSDGECAECFGGYCCSGSCQSIDCKITYPEYGWLESSTFDTEGPVAYNTIMWKGTAPGGTNVKLQLAASDNQDGPWTFYGGAACSENDYYTSLASAPAEIKCYTQFNNKRYFRYKIFLYSYQKPSGENDLTPTVEEVIVNYSE